MNRLSYPWTRVRVVPSSIPTSTEVDSDLRDTEQNVPEHLWLQFSWVPVDWRSIFAVFSEGRPFLCRECIFPNVQEIWRLPRFMEWFQLIPTDINKKPGNHTDTILSRKDVKKPRNGVTIKFHDHVCKLVRSGSEAGFDAPCCERHSKAFCQISRRLDLKRIFRATLARDCLSCPL